MRKGGRRSAARGAPDSERAHPPVLPSRRPPARRWAHFAHLDACIGAETAACAGRCGFVGTQRDLRRHYETIIAAAAAATRRLGPPLALGHCAGCQSERGAVAARSAAGFKRRWPLDGDGAAQPATLLGARRARLVEDIGDLERSLAAKRAALRRVDAELAARGGE